MRYMCQSSAHEVQELLEHPLLEFEDAITVSEKAVICCPADFWE